MFSLNPFSFSSGIHRELQEMNNFFRSFNAQNMKLDIEDLGDRYEMTVELPGLNRENINLDITDHELTIKAEQSEERDYSPKIESGKDLNRNEVEISDKRNFIHKERSFSSMQRSINLEGIKEDEISAKYENGVLLVILPKEKPEDKNNSSRSIEIN